MLKIGKVNIERYPVLLAPMEDVTDVSFRLLCKKFGVDLMYTEFISSDGLIRNGRKSERKLFLHQEERPIGIQIYGHVKESMVEATKLVEKANPDLIDINFGCPVKKIARRGAGAGMLKDIENMVSITRAVVKSTNLPVTVKTRLGWDESSKHIVEIAERLQDVGIQAITIHGRTGVQMYTGKADWTLIGKVKENPRMSIPVIGNGDITSPEIAKQMIETYGADGIMVGRATIGRPWIFKEIRSFIDEGKFFQMSLAEKIGIIREHLKESIAYKGERIGILQMRRHFANYFKALPDFRDIKIKLLTSEDISEILEILEIIKQRYSGY